MIYIYYIYIAVATVQIQSVNADTAVAAVITDVFIRRPQELKLSFCEYITFVKTLGPFVMYMELLL